MIRRIRGFRASVAAAARRRPFALSLTVMLVIVLPGYVRIEQNQHADCQHRNDSRVEQSAMWDYVIAKITPPNPTPVQAKAIRDLQAQVDKTFAIRKCGW